MDEVLMNVLVTTSLAVIYGGNVGEIEKLHYFYTNLDQNVFKILVARPKDLSKHKP